MDPRLRGDDKHGKRKSILNDERSKCSPFLSPGTAVRLDGLPVEDGGPEYGIVVHCWRDIEANFYDCYIAFFGNKWPNGEPTEKPYILRYATTSVTVLSASTD